MRASIVAGVLIFTAVLRMAAQVPFTVVDASADFVLLYDRTNALSLDRRADALKSELVRRLPDVYPALGLDPDGGRYAASIRVAIEEFPKIRSRFTRVAVEFNAMLTEAIDSFRRTFNDVGPIGPVYLVHSLGQLDGGTRTIAGARRLVFGADVMALHTFDNEQPFFHHELFHLYHARFFGTCQGMWCSLWREGLAVHVSSVLNPAATDAELLLGGPQPLRGAIDTNIAAAVCAVSENLDSTNNALYFSAGLSPPGLPPRFGYFVGYLVAREAGRVRSIQDLARLPARQARSIVVDVLSRMASCSVR